MQQQYPGVERGDMVTALSDLEDTVGIRIASKVFQDQLFTNRYLNRDYRLAGAGDWSSKQLFFIYYARVSSKS